MNVMPELHIFNTLTRKKERFEPVKKGFAGLYVCGPTVYGDAHLGHARPAITFDVLFRYLKFSGYQVRYVRNITDVGHLENDADSGDDKIARKARLEQLEPMEVAQFYTTRYHKNMEQLNVLPPSIEPRATGHIIEQIAYIKVLLENGFAYESEGSVYFDVEKYNERYHYGKLSGRVIEDLMSQSRDLEGQNDKRNSLDFALWKKASPEHIMRWPSPWSSGFPGWHLECSAMGKKYLGDVFDIHGGGMDLLFPHHECEIAQSVAAQGHDSVRYWMHNNMITINGQKMGKSLGNFITLNDFFTGTHSSLDQPYAPMTVRFFILQAHYRSTLDFSNEALSAAQKGLDRLIRAMAMIDHLPVSTQSTVDVESLHAACREALDDDLNTPVALAHLFEAVKLINKVKESREKINQQGKERLHALFFTYLVDIMGVHVGSLRDDKEAEKQNLIPGLIEMLLETRLEAKKNKEYNRADQMRDQLLALGVQIKDTAAGTEWEIL